MKPSYSLSWLFAVTAFVGLGFAALVNANVWWSLGDAPWRLASSSTPAFVLAFRTLRTDLSGWRSPCRLCFRASSLDI